jgi:hypothetical protein
VGWARLKIGFDTIGNAILICYGQPDHLQAESLEQLRSKIILLPCHLGTQIHDVLCEQGFDVQTNAYCLHKKSLH